VLDFASSEFYERFKLLLEVLPIIILCYLLNFNGTVICETESNFQ